jgi:hypothetical protein
VSNPRGIFHACDASRASTSNALAVEIRSSSTATADRAVSADIAA